MYRIGELAKIAEVTLPNNTLLRKTADDGA